MNVYINDRGVFRTQSNIYDGTFLRNFFCIDVRLGSKYISACYQKHYIKLNSNKTLKTEVPIL